MNGAGKRIRLICALSLVLGVGLLESDVSVGGVPEIWAHDLGYESGFQDYSDNHYRRGRSVVAGDFDGDGRTDWFVGNPGDESFIFQNTGPGPDGVVRFTVAQVLLDRELAFVASGADYDNDGDLDLFVGCGGLEGLCLDYLFRNDSSSGRIRFEDVSLQAGIRGPSPAGVPIPHATGGGTWGDYDRDGDQDLFVSVRAVDPAAMSYKNILWRNNGDGSFTDVTVQAGLSYWKYKPSPGERPLPERALFQNSTWIDADNDGDLDLLLNNALGPNTLWKNLLVEGGVPRFTDATGEFSPPGEDLRFPMNSFASAVADFNNDGWQDLMLFTSYDEPALPYGKGQVLFLNRHGLGFFNVASLAGINRTGGLQEMAMGCQVADLNADSIPDLVIGAGNPDAGAMTRLFLSSSMRSGIPRFDDASWFLDFEPAHGIDPLSSPFPQIPPYPYRTHGMAAADVDGDGRLELAVLNGGPASSPDLVREPNRLFHFAGPALGNTFRARLEGNGLTDSRDSIGARGYVEIPSPWGKHRVFQTVLAGSGFSAQNELTLTFGLGENTAVSRLAVLWQSGCLQVVDSPGAASASFPLVVGQACWSCPSAPGPVEAWLDPDAYGCAKPPATRLEGAIRDFSGPVPWTRVVHQHGDPARPSLEARTGLDGAFAIEHSFEAGVCRTSIIEPFGYLPVLNPARVEEATPGIKSLHLILERGPEGLWPRGAGYWLHQARSLTPGPGRAQEQETDMMMWMEAIRARYPALAGFDSTGELATTLRGGSSDSPGERLRRHLGAALLNLASGRLSSFTILTTGERVGDLMEKAYAWMGTPGADPSQASVIAAELEELNEGLLLP